MKISALSVVCFFLVVSGGSCYSQKSYTDSVLTQFPEIVLPSEYGDYFPGKIQRNENLTEGTEIIYQQINCLKDSIQNDSLLIRLHNNYAVGKINLSNQITALIVYHFSYNDNVVKREFYLITINSVSKKMIGEYLLAAFNEETKKRKDCSRFVWNSTIESDQNITSWGGEGKCGEVMDKGSAHASIDSSGFINVYY